LVLFLCLTSRPPAEQLPEPGEIEDLQEELAALRAKSESLAAEAQKVAALRRELAHAHAREEELRERLDDPRLQGKGGKELLIELELVKRRLADYEQRERAIEHREEQMQKRVDAIKYAHTALTFLRGASASSVLGLMVQCILIDNTVCNEVGNRA
jgi:chromosome segregation ATPase